jgi:hypothetical protein
VLIHSLARSIMAALGPIFLEALEVAITYSSFRKCIIMLNDDEPGCFVRAARCYASVCSPGERELLKVILLLVDFAHIADEISAGEAYGNMTRCGERSGWRSRPASSTRGTDPDDRQAAERAAAARQPCDSREDEQQRAATTGRLSSPLPWKVSALFCNPKSTSISQQIEDKSDIPFWEAIARQA